MIEENEDVERSLSIDTLEDVEDRPGATVLKGTGGRELPESVTVDVNASADAVFFLHAALPNETYKAPRTGRNQPAPQPPVLWQYEVTYADGQKALVDVRLGEHVAYWLDKAGALDKASVAWTGKAGAASRKDAHVYQMVWTNPRPRAAIRSITLRHGPDGNRYAFPLLLGITAATSR